MHQIYGDTNVQWYNKIYNTINFKQQRAKTVFSQQKTIETDSSRKVLKILQTTFSNFTWIPTFYNVVQWKIGRFDFVATVSNEKRFNITTLKLNFDVKQNVRQNRWWKWKKVDKVFQFCPFYYHKNISVKQLCLTLPKLWEVRWVQNSQVLHETSLTPTCTSVMSISTRLRQLKLRWLTNLTYYFGGKQQAKFVNRPLFFSSFRNCIEILLVLLPRNDIKGLVH